LSVRPLRIPLSTVFIQDRCIRRLTPPGHVSPLAEIGDSFDPKILAFGKSSLVRGTPAKNGAVPGFSRADVESGNYPSLIFSGARIYHPLLDWDCDPDRNFRRYRVYLQNQCCSGANCVTGSYLQLCFRIPRMAAPRSAVSKQSPKLQIISIAELLAGIQAKISTINLQSSGFKQAREEGDRTEGGILDTS
jgi:hypothetical protein